MSDNRTRIWFSLFVLAVFCLGLASGLVLGRRLAPPAQPATPRLIGGGMRPGPGIGPGGINPGGPPPGRLLERLDDVLDLTPDQHAKVEQIFESRRKALESVQDEVLARAEKEQRELQDEIRTVLTPEQQQRFDRWLADMPRGRRGRGPGMGPMGQPPGR
jgi:Spy/CpxP family protein refolding chaperone